MAFKQFRFNIVLRVLLLTATCLALFITLNSAFTFTPILVAGLIIYQVWSLIRYVDRTNRELAGFLESIRYSEFTRTFQINDGGSSFDELARVQNPTEESHSIFTLYSSENGKIYLSIKNKSAKTDKEGEISFDEDEFVKCITITRQMSESLLEKVSPT